MAKKRKAPDSTTERDEEEEIIENNHTPSLGDNGKKVLDSIDCETTVCNVKVQFLRPKYQNLKEWVRDPNNIYIGRAGVVFIDGKRFPSHGSVWSNPFKIGKDGNRDQVLQKFKSYITEKIESEDLQPELLKLKGKNLGCWCIPKGCTRSIEPMYCHGQVLLEILKDS